MSRGMPGVCPECGFAADLVAFVTDPEWRAVVNVLPEIPPQLQRRAISFLGLFRKTRNALRPSTALKVLRGLQEMTSAGTVYWEGGETRPAPVELWAEALDAMLEGGKRGFTDRQGLNYLRHTAWEKAAGIAAKIERKHESAAPLRYFEPDPAAPKKKSCFNCISFRPPKSCKKSYKPVSGNQMLGCGDGWEEKTHSIGDVLGGLEGKIAVAGSMESKGEDRHGGETGGREGGG